MWGKVHGQKCQGLSKAGKEVLDKSVLQAVSTYTVSVFQFAKSFCTQLVSVSSNFWWGAKDGECKVHWIGWPKMCLCGDLVYGPKLCVE